MKAQCGEASGLDMEDGERSMSDFEYQDLYRLVYGVGAHFVPVCETCGRFVKADERIKFDSDDQPVGDNAECSKCGRVAMLFEGYY